MYRRNEFPSSDACLAYIAAERYPNGVTVCVKCKAERKHIVSETVPPTLAILAAITFTRLGGYL